MNGKVYFGGIGRTLWGIKVAAPVDPIRFLPAHTNKQLADFITEELKRRILKKKEPTESREGRRLGPKPPSPLMREIAAALGLTEEDAGNYLAGKYPAEKLVTSWLIESALRLDKDHTTKILIEKLGPNASRLNDLLAQFKYPITRRG